MQRPDRLCEPYCIIHTSNLQFISRPYIPALKLFRSRDKLRNIDEHVTRSWTSIGHLSATVSLHLDAPNKAKSADDHFDMSLDAVITMMSTSHSLRLYCVIRVAWLWKPILEVQCINWWDSRSPTYPGANLGKLVLLQICTCVGFV